jgi:hypothetical protein
VDETIRCNDPLFGKGKAPFPIFGGNRDTFFHAHDFKSSQRSPTAGLKRGEITTVISDDISSNSIPT